MPFSLRSLRHGHLCGVQHIFNENAVAARGVVDHDVRYRADELAVLDDGGAGHECGQERTTKFVIFFIKFLASSISSSVGKICGRVFFIFNATYFEPA